ncbi:bifunctional metallophosphatase/5'-nucleotidase [Endozoicomonas lisbonensis]|uniref:2',3'-cyclic-nucleotide 2'-phosphodiesterase/3'-nucleotidase n=1 Tax=Endozoicomonas lisbonensis TaxID=3120522 RepID=A0ABV2SK68_9GAMM
MKPFKIAALSAAVMMSLTGCSYENKPADTPEQPPLAECKTLYNTPEVVVKGNNHELTAQTITIGATGDMHGRIWAYDYALDREDSSAGFSKIATLLKKERINNPDMIMIDLGDTVQGNSAELFNNMPIHPVVETMNIMEYDLWVPGNHEFDFERSFLDRNLVGFNGSVVSSNIIWDKNSDTCSANSENVPFLPGFQIFDVNGAKVAVVGVTPSLVPNWQASNPDNFRNLDFTNEVEAISASVQQAIQKYSPDVVIGALHLGRWEAGTGVYEVASKMADKFDVIFMGHEHAQFIEQMYHNDPVEGGMKDITVDGNAQEEDKDLAGIYNELNRHTKVKVIEPGKWGWALAKAEIELKKDTDGNWNIVDTTLSNQVVTDIEESVEIQDKFRDTHKTSVDDANQVIGRVEGYFTNSPTGYVDEATNENYEFVEGFGPRLYTTIHHAKVADMPLVDLINQLQVSRVEEVFAKDSSISHTTVDVSAAALFADTSNLVDGQEYRKKDSSNLYMYDNMLVAVEISGANLKDYMEWSYTYLKGYQEGDLTVSFNTDIPSFNYDLFDGEGFRYEVDLSKAPRVNGHDGKRIIIHEIAGAAFDENATYVLAINDYRYGSTLLPMGWITEDDKLWDSSNETVYAIRDMLTEKVAKQGGLKREDYVNQNWFITQYGQADDNGKVTDKGAILALREDGGAGQELWERLVNKEICVVLEGDRTRAIGVSVNINDESSWYENPEFSKDASQEDLYRGCSS